MGTASLSFSWADIRVLPSVEDKVSDKPRWLRGTGWWKKRKCRRGAHFWSLHAEPKFGDLRVCCRCGRHEFWNGEAWVRRINSQDMGPVMVPGGLDGEGKPDKEER